MIQCIQLSRRGLATGTRISTTPLSFARLTAARVRSSPSMTVRQYNYITNPMTPQEEQDEKDRVTSLTPFQKEMELRSLDQQLAKLHMLRGIATGELYTWRGKFKALARDYGMPFMMWYWTCWVATAGMTYGAIELGGWDAMALIAQLDNLTGFHLVDKVDPTVGTIGVTLVVNEMLEPLRLPIVIMTTKPVVHFLSPPKY